MILLLKSTPYKLNCRHMLMIIMSNAKLRSQLYLLPRNYIRNCYYSSWMLLSLAKISSIYSFGLKASTQLEMRQTLLSIFSNSPLLFSSIFSEMSLKTSASTLTLNMTQYSIRASLRREGKTLTVLSMEVQSQTIVNDSLCSEINLAILPSFFDRKTLGQYLMTSPLMLHTVMLHLLSLEGTILINKRIPSNPDLQKVNSGYYSLTRLDKFLLLYFLVSIFSSEMQLMKAYFFYCISLSVSLGLSFALILRQSLSAGGELLELNMEDGLRMSLIKEDGYQRLEATTHSPAYYQ